MDNLIFLLQLLGNHRQVQTSTVLLRQLDVCVESPFSINRTWIA